MTTILVILAMVVIVGILAVFYEIRKLRSAREQGSGEGQEVLMEWLKEMKADQRHSTETLQKQVHNTNQELGKRLDNAARVVQSVGTEVGKMQEIGQSMKELQQIMKSPKLRGNLGEEVMKNALQDLLPKDGYKMQYKFKSGDTVDAVIKTKNGLIPLDSKFPVENYLAAQKADDPVEKERLKKQFGKDIKLHIDKISKKYILPAEDTVDFAIMYVPGESVYYEIITSTELAEYGEGKKVYLVSPNTFHYFLQTVMVAFSGEQIEQQAKEVMVALQAIRGDAQKLGTDLGVLGRHVTNANKTMGTVSDSYTKLGSKIDGASQLKGAKAEAVQGKLEHLSELPAEAVTDPTESAEPAPKK